MRKERQRPEITRPAVEDLSNRWCNVCNCYEHHCECCSDNPLIAAEELTLP